VDAQEEQRPVGPLPPSKPPPARHRPGVQSARRDCCPPPCTADCLPLPRSCVMRWTSQNSRRAGTKARGTKRRPTHRPVVEVLEDRLVPSTIEWVNRGSAQNDSDGFNGVFGNNAEVARNVVAAALKSWQDVIVSFNYSDRNLEDRYRMTVNMAPNGTGLGA